MPANRVSKKKKPDKNIVLTGGDLSSPTTKEWASMTSYGAFIVVDGDGKEHEFKLGATASILPGTAKVGKEREIHNDWVARILAIRGRDYVPKKTTKAKSQPRVPEFWVQVRWYYSPKEVSFRIEGFNESHCSKFERIISDHSEVVSALTFNGLVSLVKFREDDPDQEPIYSDSGDKFFARYFLKTSLPRGEIESYSLKTFTNKPAGCICGHPYDLKAKASLSIMHMCPRPRCRCFYHSACLLQHGHWTRKTHPLIRLSSSPDTDDIPVLSPCRTQKPESDSLSEAIRGRSPELPDTLLTLAAQPIVRGAALRALGFTGNSRAVVAARRLVYAALENGTAVSYGWEKNAELAIVEPVLPALQLDETGEALVFMCPNCSGPI
ncbi:hypothetical protein DFH09DRAFT_197345 [Mycena vulgaris]|nr:hypothetical protein DFH09DRAFT_197345 [Mycena vulgaris]